MFLGVEYVLEPFREHLRIEHFLEIKQHIRAYDGFRQSRAKRKNLYFLGSKYVLEGFFVLGNLARRVKI